MRVSLNEIQVMCRKAFEGMGFAAGDCEDAAELVGWLQLQGLDASVRWKKPCSTCKPKLPSRTPCAMRIAPCW